MPNLGHKALFLHSALNVKVKKFIQARVNGGSNYDSLKVGRWVDGGPCPTGLEAAQGRGPRRSQV